MYSPIPEVAPADEEVGKTDLSVEKEESKLLLVRRFLWRAFLGSFGLTCLVFGLYVASFYLQSLIKHQLDAWDITGPGMYHKDRPDSNYALGAHFVGGAYLMLFGPLQFIPVIRQKWMTFHRWNGRLSIAGCLLAALGGSYYVCSVGSSQVDFVGQSANWNNLVFGMAMLTCGIQTYRHAAITKRIDQHKLWAYRVAALCFGNIFVRIGIWAMIVVLSIDSDPEGFKDELVHSEVFKSGLNFLLYTFVVPSILLAGEIWKHEQRGDSTPSLLFLVFAALLLVLFVLGVALLMLVAWIPFIGRSLDYYN